ncbi:hypothetical protein BH11ARM2_BH11ARM2_31570 [soil metagenome]
MNQVSGLDGLLIAASSLTSSQIELLAEVATVFKRNIEETRSSKSDIATELFCADFRNRLLLHHAISEAKLSKKLFEYAFASSCRFTGRSASITTSDTHAGADVVVDNIAFSLKTEACKSIRANSITISKFSEGRWIQQASSLEELARETTTRIPRQLKNYARIGVLRAHSLADLKVKYELVEIPVAVLRLVAGLTADDFSPRTPQGGSTARVLRKGLPVFTLRLDGSDGKVSLTNLDLALCRVHATWTVPVVGVDSVEEVI